MRRTVATVGVVLIALGVWWFFREPSAAAPHEAEAKREPTKTPVEVKGQSRELAAFLARAAGKKLHLEFKMIDGATQTPIAGAIVEAAISCDEPRIVLVTAISDAEGRVAFELPNFDPNELGWSARRDGFVTNPCFVVKPTTRTISLNPLQRLSGRVLNPNGTPAANAEVTVVTDRPPSPSTTTGIDGTFTLQAEGSGLLCARLGNWSATADLKGDTRLDLTLGPSSRYAGVVVDELDGGALAGVLVEVETGTIVETTTTDDDGHFAMGAPCENHLRFGTNTYGRFSKPGYITRYDDLRPSDDDAEKPAPLPSPAPGEVVVPLTATASIKGTVIDHLGAPVPFAIVEICSQRPTRGLADEAGRFFLSGAKREDCVAAFEGLRGASVDVVTKPGEVVEVIIDVGEPQVQVPLSMHVDDDICAEDVWNLHVLRTSGAPFEHDMPWSSRPLHVDVVYPQTLRLPAGTFVVTAVSQHYAEYCEEARATVTVDVDAASQPVFEMHSRATGH